MARMGFLLVTMQPPPAFEEEFNAWYDTEHVPERLAVPGIETALRYINLGGGAPRYLAMYDLAAPEVMQSEAYLRVAFDRSSPWTKRVTGRVRVNRAAGVQVAPGDLPTGRAAQVTLLRFAGAREAAVPAVLEGLRASFGPRPETRQMRVLLGDAASGSHVFGFVESRAPTPVAFDCRAFGAAAESLDLAAGFVPW